MGLIRGPATAHRPTIPSAKRKHRSARGRRGETPRWSIGGDESPLHTVNSSRFIPPTPPPLTRRLSSCRIFTPTVVAVVPRRRGGCLLRCSFIAGVQRRRRTLRGSGHGKPPCGILGVERASAAAWSTSCSGPDIHPPPPLSCCT
jgi:hypothetical protein